MSKCKMCGGNLDIKEGQTVVTCDYCGSQQTVSATDSERLARLFDTANIFRMKSYFDSAAEKYERILENDPEDAEAYWGKVLCKYGIEYVKEPITGIMVPTIHRAQYESILADPDYLSAISNADIYQKIVYEREATAIAELIKEVMAIAEKEEPYDVFISFKDTDENKNKTEDSEKANRLYHELRLQGYRVFYSNITLKEEHAGEKYEPYIYAALHSAKAMVVVGTKKEYFEAPWVKNEWGRYLKIMDKEPGKIIIPCYKNMSDKDLPADFRQIKPLDMEMLGFMEELFKRIESAVGKKKEERSNAKAVSTNSTASKTEPLIKRAQMFLEDGDWEKANEYCDRILDVNPECAEAYIISMMSFYKISNINGLNDVLADLSEDDNYRKAFRYSTKEKQVELETYRKNSSLKYAKILRVDALKELSEQKIKKCLRLLEEADVSEERDFIYEKAVKNAEQICEKLAELTWESKKEKLSFEKDNYQKELYSQKSHFGSVNNELNAKKNTLNELVVKYNNEKSKIEGNINFERQKIDNYGSDVSKKMNASALVILLAIGDVGLAIFLLTRIPKGNSPIFDIISYGGLALLCLRAIPWILSFIQKPSEVESVESHQVKIRREVESLKKRTQVFEDEKKKLDEAIAKLEKEASETREKISRTENVIKEYEKSIKIDKDATIEKAQYEIKDRIFAK